MRVPHITKVRFSYHHIIVFQHISESKNHFNLYYYKAYTDSLNQTLFPGNQFAWYYIEMNNTQNIHWYYMVENDIVYKFVSLSNTYTVDSYLFYIVIIPTFRLYIASIEGIKWVGEQIKSLISLEIELAVLSRHLLVEVKGYIFW